MAKVKKEEVHLVSSLGTGYFYTFRRNKKKKSQTKLSLEKYDPIARQTVKFEEGKLKKLDRKTRFKKNVAATATKAAKSTAEKAA